MHILGRPFDAYDWMTLGAAVLLAAVFMTLLLLIMGLPGRIAVSRNHPHAESVRVMGWLGFLAVVPWVHAFMWSYHDSMTVDLRRMPKEEKDEVAKEIARMKGESPPASPAPSADT